MNIIKEIKTNYKHLHINIIKPYKLQTSANIIKTYTLQTLANEYNKDINYKQLQINIIKSYI